jgi:hypothetical protein
MKVVDSQFDELPALAARYIKMDQKLMRPTDQIGSRGA